MAIALEERETHWLIRLEGQVNLTSAAELKRVLVEWLAAAKDLELDLLHVEEIDLVILQLLWAAGRDGAHQGAGIVSHLSPVAATALRNAGFDGMPALANSGASVG